MSTKKISAGDTLTVGDLTDDHLGAVIEVSSSGGITYRLRLERLLLSAVEARLYAPDGGIIDTLLNCPVKVIAPPPVVQPDEPTILGQCIRIEGLPGYEALVVDPSAGFPFLYRLCGSVWHTRSWEEILEDAGDRRIIVSDPPRWPDETPVVPERIEDGEWPDDDTHLREWAWLDCDGRTWQWRGDGWTRVGVSLTGDNPVNGPWIRGEHVE